MAVTEACFRLARSQSVAVDIGANVGHMTSALVHGVQSGLVLAYEPHPTLYSILHKNADRFEEERSEVTVLPRQEAVAETMGVSTLYVPERWSHNCGLSSLREPRGTSNAKEIEVQVCCLDKEVREEICVLKIDVEGYEYEVLSGAESLLSGHFIHHIIFEDHDGRGSKVIRYLKGMGYRVFGLKESLVKPSLVSNLSLFSGYNFVATAREDECVERFESIGWRCLRQS
nr:FkbM family methyltransferase [Salinibacter ruber]